MSPPPILPPVARGRHRGGRDDHPPRNRINPLLWLWYKIWFASPLHVVFVAALLCAATICYVRAHTNWGYRQEQGQYVLDTDQSKITNYWFDARPLIKDAIGIFQIKEDPNSHLFTIFQESRPWDGTPVQDKEVTLGIEKLPSVRGLIANYQGRLDTYNAGIRDRVQSVLSSMKWMESDSGAGIDLSIFRSTKNDGEEFRGTAFITQADFDSIKARPPNAQTSRDLKGALENCEAIDYTKKSVQSWKLTGVAETVDMVDRSKLGLKVVEQEAPLYALELDKKGNLPTPARSAIQHYFSPDYLLNRYRSDVAKALNNKTEELDKVGIPELQSALHNELLIAAKGELGFFWLFGHWRWYEIMWWTWFGVLTNSLIYLGIYLVRRGPRGTIWDPRETLKNLSALFYAPIMSIAIIWGLTQTNLLGKNAFTTGDAAVAVFVAFVLGTFPGIPHKLLTTIAKTLFKDTSVAASKKPAKHDKVVTVTGLPAAPPNAPLHIADLKNSIGNAATAILKNTERS